MMEHRIVIGFPSYGRIEPETAMSLCALIAGADGAVVDTVMYNFIYVDQCRNTIVRTVLDGPLPDALRLHGASCKPQDITHLLFLDADMTWPADLVPRLLKHRVPVVGAVYYGKQPPFTPVPFTFGEDLGVVRLETVPTGGLMACAGLGMGATLIRTDVLRKMRDHYGDEKWFRSEECGEDVHFCRRLVKMSPPVQAYCDTDAKCGHIRTEVVTEAHRLAFERWQAALAVQQAKEEAERQRREFEAAEKKAREAERVQTVRDPEKERAAVAAAMDRLERAPGPDHRAEEVKGVSA